MRQRAATARALGNDNLTAQPGQHADRGVVDIGVQRLLRATRHQCHTQAAFTLRGKHLRAVIAADGRDLLRRHLQHRPQPRIRHQEGKGSPDLGPQQSQPEPRGVRKDLGQRPTQQPVHEWSLVGLLDMRARVIDQMHVMHAGRAGAHAGQAGQAAVDMLDRFLIRRAALFQHVLDKVDAPARAVQLIAQHGVGRAGRRAEAAMHAGPQDLIGALDGGVLQLLGREGGLHVLLHQPGVQDPARIEPLAQAGGQHGHGRGLGLE